MPINMSCPSCGKLLAAPDSAAGKRAKCPECAQVMLVPSAVVHAELTSESAAAPPSDGGPGPSGNWLDGLGAGSAQGQPAPAGDEQRRPCPECGEMIMAAAAKCRFCGTIFDPRLRGTSYRALHIGHGSPAEQVRRIRAPFTTFWSSLALAVVLGVLSGVIGAIQQTPELAIAGVVMALLVALVGAIAYLVLLYRLWSVVQDGRAQTTPGCAVGFLFIPCFNYYWQFVAVWGLAKELNRISREYRFAAPEANEGLALTACIVHCCVLVAGGFAALAWFIISIIAMKGMCDTAAAIVGAPAAPTVASGMNQPYPV